MRRRRKRRKRLQRHSCRAATGSVRAACNICRLVRFGCRLQDNINFVLVYVGLSECMDTGHSRLDPSGLVAADMNECLPSLSIALVPMRSEATFKFASGCRIVKMKLISNRTF